MKNFSFLILALAFFIGLPSFSNPIEESDSCFSLAAKPSTKYPQADELTWFSIKFDPNNDGVIKNCGDSKKKYCEKGNTW